MYNSINPHDPYGVYAYGEPLVNFGLVNRSAINGFGLVTRGFLWQDYYVWGPYAGISLTTSWSPSQDPSLVTVWTVSSNNELPSAF